MVSSTIKLHNPTDNNVCFKVKTTAPKKYCVRPNSGVVEPQSTVSVAGMLFIEINIACMTKTTAIYLIKRIFYYRISYTKCLL